MVDLYSDTPEYEKIVHYDAYKNIQVKLTINNFRDIEYLHLRKYYQDFDETWKPSNEGIAMPLGFDNVRELFIGLVEILSLAESKEILESNFKDLLDMIYIK